MVGGSGEEQGAEIRLHSTFDGSVVFSFLICFHLFSTLHWLCDLRGVTEVGS